MTCDICGIVHDCTSPAPTYTDDIIVVMRATIDLQRLTIADRNATIAHLEACNEQLKIGEVEALREVARLRAKLAESPLPEGM